MHSIHHERQLTQHHLERWHAWTTRLSLCLPYSHQLLSALRSRPWISSSVIATERATKRTSAFYRGTFILAHWTGQKDMVCDVMGVALKHSTCSCPPAAFQIHIHVHDAHQNRSWSSDNEKGSRDDPTKVLISLQVSESEAISCFR